MKSLSLIFLLITINSVAIALPVSDSLLASNKTMSGSLNEVTVTASNQRARRFVDESQMGKVDLPVSMMKRVPVIAGESDIIKALQLTPGVKSGTQGTIGMYVRGGGNDENLVLLDGAPVYNAGHLLGFFSVFNTATLKDVQLYKSSFPAQYGGRLSSVLDVKTKEGSLSDYKVSGSLGLIASSVSVQGPVIKDKLSFMLSARRTYIDKVFKNIPYHFYDLNGKLMYVINPNNRIYLSIYKGDDVLSTKTQQGDSASGEQQVKSGMKLGNQVAVLKWNHLAKNNKYSTDLSVLYTGFKYSIDGRLQNNALSVRSSIRDMGIKGDIKTYNTGKHTMVAGFSLVNHFFNPNIVHSEGDMLSRFNNNSGKEIYNNEAGVYVNDDYRINSKWLISSGLRISADAVPGKTYIGLEPRMAVRYRIDERQSVKMSYARMTQYMHLVSSSSLALPTDLWYPVTASIKPGISNQLSAGYYYTVPSIDLNISGEVYYKAMNNLVEYREGALLVLNNDYEKELVHGKGRAYGLELFANKTAGKFTGWISYSLSYAHRKFDSLNKGKEYYAQYDRRHDLALVGIYDFNKHWGISSTIVYATGNPFTGQASQYVMPKPDFTGFEVMPAYTGRNELRMSSTFRIDLDVQYKFSIGKKIKADAHISVYNLLNRAQPHSVRRVWDNSKGAYKYQQTGLFGIIPTATLNFNL